LGRATNRKKEKKPTAGVLYGEMQKMLLKLKLDRERLGALELDKETT